VIILTGAIVGWTLTSLPFRQSVVLADVALILVVVFLPKLNFYLSILDWWHTWRDRKSFKIPRIGIFNGYIKREKGEFRCPTGFTSVTPERWQERLELTHKKIKTELIGASRVSRKFNVIINPFGEMYPESDLYQRTTFKAIKKFIQEGGIFVHAGGIPFYYSWDTKANRPNPTSKDLQFYSFKMKTDEELEEDRNIVISPAYLRGGKRTPSLVDTLARQHFLLRTTADDGNGNRVEAFQTEAERRFGDLISVGGTAIIYEFRAVTNETPKFIPFLRCKTKYSENDVFPLAGIPFGRGFLLVAGMNFEISREIDSLIVDSQVEKVCMAIIDLTNGIYQHIL